MVVEEPVTEGKMGEATAGLGDLEVSISFGRFENDLLSWERWSSFSQNKYLAEVEKCSTPGSVAEKKAYFEAHYKKVAAKKAEIEDKQKQVDANLLMAANNNGESSIATKKEETENGLKPLDANLSVEEKPIGESVPADTYGIVNRQKQVEVSNSAEELSGAHPIESIQSVTAHLQSSEKQTDDFQSVNKVNGMNYDQGITIIDEQANDGGIDGVCRTMFTDEQKKDSNLRSETSNTVVGELVHETHFTGSSSLVEAPKDTDHSAGEIFKSSNKDITKPKPQKMTKVLLANTERNLTKVKKAPLSVTPISPQISSSTPKKLMPKSTPYMMSPSRSSATKGSKSSASSSKGSYAEQKKLIPKTDTLSLSPGSIKYATVTATRKSMFMEKMGDKDIVKRAFNSFQPKLGPMKSTGEHSGSLPMLVSRTTKKIEVKEPKPIASQKGKEWLNKSGVISANVAQVTPTSVSSISDTVAQKGKEMKKVTRNMNVKVAAGSDILVASKEANESTAQILRKNRLFKATPLPAFYRGNGVSKSLIRKESPNPKP